MVNTIFVHEINYMICVKECSIKDQNAYFKVKPKTSLCSLRLRQLNNTWINKVKVTYLPLNCNISTTGHKLQGKTLDKLIVNSWAYHCQHWVYVVLSRVKRMDGLILNSKLDESKDYTPDNKLIRWEKRTKERVEKKTFKDRGKDDYIKYLREESIYLSDKPTT